MRDKYDMPYLNNEEISALMKKAPLGFISNLKVYFIRSIAGYVAAEDLKMELHFKTWQRKCAPLFENCGDGFDHDRILRDALHEEILEERSRTGRSL